jgi:pimeloyl-ACP methyl ester carboxylesterase
MEQFVQANGVDLCAETFGDRGDPAILLIMGSSASMDWWEDEFCRRLASGPRFVIRYDQRDTGRSVTYEPGAPGYSFRDLVTDAVEVLDALDVDKAHVAGMSMGGAVAQLVALRHPERVTSLTLISTGPVGARDPDLPGMSDETIAQFSVPPPDWSDPASVTDYLVHLARVSAGTSPPFDEPAFRALAARVLDRTTNIESSMTNHNVLLAGDDASSEQAADVNVPTLVVHGTADPVVTYPHGVALARKIDGAELVTLEGMGHELPAGVWDTVVPAILAHTARA